MKFRILAFLATAVFFISCDHRKDSTTFSLNPSNLKSSFISLDPDSAYTLRTPKGTIIKIGPGSFEVKGNDKVELELKEAFSIQDMLLAGLTTRSDEKFLQSGGMIYVNATSKGKPVHMAKPIKVSIPSKLYDDRMQLFKGEVKDDGSINWIDPRPLDTSPVVKTMINGKILFKATCASCHKPTMEFAAPPLALVRSRTPDRDWSFRFTRNPFSMYETDPYAKYIFRKYNKIMMPAYPQLTREEVNAILDYCDNEELKNPFPKNTSPSDSIDTQPKTFCGYDTVYFPVTDTTIKPLLNVLETDSITTATYQPPAYEFNIDQSGWYNVDCFINTYESAGLLSSVNLFASIKMPNQIDMQVYLCIPSRKLLTNGTGPGNKNYTFYQPDGSISLIKNDEAFIFAIGADTASAYYGITRFTVQNDQNIIVNVKASTKEEILKAIKNNNLDSLKIDIEKPRIYTIQPLSKDSIKNDDLNKEMQMEIIERPCFGDSASTKRLAQILNTRK